jgi:Tol biopolymer transport system component
MPGRKSGWLLCLAFLTPIVYGLPSSPPLHRDDAAAISAPAPQVFEPGVISGPANDGAPAFSPDGNTLFFTRSASNWGMILESHKIKGHWSKPTPAPFSGEWPDWSLAMSPDGSYLVYVSVRPPATPSSSSGDQPNNKEVHRFANLWRVDRVGSGWSKPTRLPDTVNIGHSIWKPSIATDGSIYFVSIDAKGGKRLYFSRYANGTYLQAQPLPFSDGTTADVDPEVAADGSFLVFCSSGRRPGDSKDHLFIVLKNGNAWGPVMPLRYAGDDLNGSSTDDEPRLGPDHSTLYFSSDRAVPTVFPRTPEQAQRDFEHLESWDNGDGNSNVWFFSLSEWLKAQLHG